MSTGSGTGGGGSKSPDPSPPEPSAPHEAGGVDERLASTKQTVDALEKRVSELEEQLAKARESLAQSERRREVYRLLVESGATDVEAASALIMEKIDKVVQPDIADEVRALKRRKPAMFKRSSPASSMGGRDSDPPASPAETAHKDAKGGGRAALLRYMRARRTT